MEGQYAAPIPTDQQPPQGEFLFHGKDNAECLRAYRESQLLPTARHVSCTVICPRTVSHRPKPEPQCCCERAVLPLP
jgi:hypothetical protein